MPFYTEWTFHVLVGVIAATAGGFRRRAWCTKPFSRWISSTRQSLQTTMATGLRMRARNFLEEASLAAGRYKKMLEGVKPGQKIEIDFEQQGKAHVITKVK